MASSCRGFVPNIALRLQPYFTNRNVTGNGICRVFHRSLTATSRPLMEKQTMKVPTMGDSITEVRSCLSSYVLIINLQSDQIVRALLSISVIVGHYR